MKISLTGGTGFIGRYIVANLLNHGHELKCWYRSQSSFAGMESLEPIEWVRGDLAAGDSLDELVHGSEAVIHNAFWKPGTRFQGEEGDVATFVQTNVVGTLRLIEAAMAAGVRKFVFVSTCAVHDRILSDRKLDEAHPLWPRSHYGAHKAAIEKFVHSYGWGHGFDICAIRPTGVYGMHHEPARSKWFDLVQSVVQGDTVTCDRGGKEVHAADVAEAIRLLLDHDATRGEAYSCYDRYVSEWEVANLAREISQSEATILGEMTRPKNEIDSSKIQSIGMRFGGTPRLRSTIEQLVQEFQS